MQHKLLIMALSALFALVLPRVCAQEIVFSGKEIINLSHAIAAEAARANQLPSAYQMTMANGHAMVVVAPSAFELLCRTLVTWRETKSFPNQVALKLLDITGPSFDPSIEPSRPGMLVAMPTTDFNVYTPRWLMLIEAPGHKLPSRTTFEAGYKLTAAQVLVAMATVIDETVKRGDLPDAVTVPLVSSPRNWLNTERPVSVAAQTTELTNPQPQPDPEPRVDLSFAINDILLAENGPVLPAGGNGPIPPFCGVVRIAMTGFGPVAQIRLILDSQELKTFRGVGPHLYELNTLPIPDGVHTISATATDAIGRTYAYVFSFTVQNGRQAGFTPAEVESK